MPDSYRVNEMPSLSIVESGNAVPEMSYLRRGILTAAESAECIGGQLACRGDRTAALVAALFVDHLQKSYPDVFQGQPRWRTRFPADLGRIIRGLDAPRPDGTEKRYLYEGIDAVRKALLGDPRVATFLAEGGSRPTSGASDDRRPHT